MGSETLEARLRQLLAADMNARDVYEDLARNVPDKKLAALFDAIAKDEARHVATWKGLLSLLEKMSPSF
ncbi:MAG: hypothetical protein RDV41_03290 [Planctomycetota bacterium]|nr:hypothetical protein [Planctomycetota bacterium]